MFLNGVVSGKVGRKGKVKTINTLSELAMEVDVVQYVMLSCLIISLMSL